LITKLHFFRNIWFSLVICFHACFIQPVCTRDIVTYTCEWTNRHWYKNTHHVVGVIPSCDGTSKDKFIPPNRSSFYTEYSCFAPIWQGG